MDTFTNVTALLPSNSSCPEAGNFLYWALNCYPMTLADVLANSVLFILGIVIIILNIITIQAVFQRRQMDSVSDIAITSLASTDALSGFLLAYFAVYNLVSWQIFYECLLRIGLTWGANLTSALHLWLLTMDRYIKITRPYAYPNIFKRQRVLIISAIMWISGFGLCLSPIMGWNNRTGMECGIYYVLQRDFIIVVVIAFTVPLFVNYMLYAHIFQIAHRHAKEIASQTMTTTLNPRPSRKTWKFTKTVFMLWGYYTICWSPLGLFMVLEYFNQFNHMSLDDRIKALTFLSIPAYLYNLGNPIIYAFQITYIQQHCVKVFGKIPCCCCIRRKPNFMVNSLTPMNRP